MANTRSRRPSISISRDDAPAPERAVSDLLLDQWMQSRAGLQAALDELRLGEEAKLLANVLDAMSKGVVSMPDDPPPQSASGRLSIRVAGIRGKEPAVLLSGLIVRAVARHIAPAKGA